MSKSDACRSFTGRPFLSRTTTSNGTSPVFITTFSRSCCSRGRCGCALLRTAIHNRQMMEDLKCLRLHIVILKLFLKHGSLVGLGYSRKFCDRKQNQHQG